MEPDTYCPMAKTDCPGCACVLWGNILSDGCDLTQAYGALPYISRHLFKLNETLELIDARLCSLGSFDEQMEELSKNVYNVRGAIAELDGSLQGLLS